jgi:uncharacterized protein DUF6602
MTLGPRPSSRPIAKYDTMLVGSTETLNTAQHLDKNQLQALLRGRVRAAVGSARAASSVTHQGLKGAILEILISKLFRPLLPADIGVGTGQIVECHKGTLSNQIDVVLYDRSILPPELVDDRTGIFPIEAVLYAIEVKTTLTHDELRTSHQNAAKLDSFSYLSGQINEDGTEKHHPIEKVRSVVFALKSDLSGTQSTEIDRYKEIYGDDIPYIRAICVAGREYWYDTGQVWVSQSPNDEFDEVLGFIGGVTNTYRGVARSRGYPKLGMYIVPHAADMKDVKLVPSRRQNPELECNSCGKKFTLTTSLGALRLTIKGAVSVPQPCPDCRGALATKPGRYETVDGVLKTARSNQPQ